MNTDVEAVYNSECHKPLKIAHKLTETVLHPKGFEKVNVKLAVSLLHESTIAALKEHGFSNTAAVLELFSKRWSILNVLYPDLGKRKRDIFRDPVRSLDDWKLDYLLDFSVYIIYWENSKLNLKSFIFK